MTATEWREQLLNAISQKTDEDLKNSKRDIFQQFAFSHADKYAWTDKKKPTGVSSLRRKILEDMKTTFGDLYEDNVCRECAKIASLMYY